MLILNRVLSILFFVVSGISIANADISDVDNLNVGSTNDRYDFIDDVHYVDTVVDGHDWRVMYPDWATANKGHAQFIAAGKHRTFNYYTDDKKMWFNYTFFEHRPDVWYQLYDAKADKVLQTGWTTVTHMIARNRYYDSQTFYELEVKFDVVFRPETYMQPYIYVRAERQSLRDVTRGYVRDWSDATKRFSDFQILNKHESYGIESLDEGADEENSEQVGEVAYQYHPWQVGGQTNTDHQQ